MLLLMLHMLLLLASTTHFCFMVGQVVTTLPLAFYIDAHHVAGGWAVCPASFLPQLQALSP
jgi:hypothetical protein